VPVTALPEELTKKVEQVDVEMDNEEANAEILKAS